MPRRLAISTFDDRRRLRRPVRRHVAVVALLLPSMFGGGCCFWRQQNPVDEQVLLSRQFTQQGVNALERQNLDDAERLCSEAVRAAPDDAEARSSYADVLWARNRRQDALHQMQTALDREPSDSNLLLRTASMQLDMALTDDALRNTQRAIDQNPKSAQAWVLRGRIHRHVGSVPQALADFQRALSYEPRNQEALEQAASICTERGNPHRALVYLQALADTYPTGEEPQSLYIAEGVADAAMQRHAEAATALAGACRGPAPGADALLLLAEAQTAAGRPGEAFATAQRAMAAAPNDARCQALFDRTQVALQPGSAGGTLRR